MDKVVVQETVVRGGSALLQAPTEAAESNVAAWVFRARQ
jgi:hypothetical protein